MMPRGLKGGAIERRASGVEREQSRVSLVREALDRASVMHEAANTASGDELVVVREHDNGACGVGGGGCSR